MLYHILKINILLYLILGIYFPVPGEVNWVDLEEWDILQMLLKCEKYLNDCLTSKKYHNIDLAGKSGLTHSWEFGLISTMQGITWLTAWKSRFSGSQKKSPTGWDTFEVNQTNVTAWHLTESGKSSTRKNYQVFTGNISLAIIPWLNHPFLPLIVTYSYYTAHWKSRWLCQKLYTIIFMKYHDYFHDDFQEYLAPRKYEIKFWLHLSANI